MEGPIFFYAIGNLTQLNTLTNSIEKYIPMEKGKHITERLHIVI